MDILVTITSWRYITQHETRLSKYPAGPGYVRAIYRGGLVGATPMLFRGGTAGGRQNLRVVSSLNY